MVETIIICRILLIILGAGSLFLFAKLLKPPKEVLIAALKWCWVAGVLNLIVDFFEQKLGFWHYTLSGLVFGFPLDIYVAVSLFIGGSLCLIYWWIDSAHNKLVKPFFIVLPLYFLLQDYLVTFVSGNDVIVFDSPLWWIADIVSLTIILWGTLLVFIYFVRKDRTIPWRLVIVGLLVAIPTVITGAVLYPWGRISIDFISTKPLASTLADADFGAQFLGIPSHINQYRIHIAFNPPKECSGTPSDPAFVEYSLESADSLVPYMEQVFATTSCESIFSDHKNAGLPQYINGDYVFCLPAGSSVSFLYPSDALIPLHLTNPPEWTSGSDACPDILMKQMGKSQNALMPYMQIYADPSMGELLIGWLGALMVWIVILASGIAIYDFIRGK